MPKFSLSCEDARILIAGLVDGELDQEQESAVQGHIRECKSCAETFNSFTELKEGTADMKFKKLPEMYWDEYWEHVYNKIERGMGWIFLSIGVILLLMFSGYQLLSEFFLDAGRPLILRFGVGILLLGLIVLIVSVLREKLMVRRVDLYRRVKR